MKITTEFNKEEKKRVTTLCNKVIDILSDESDAIIALVLLTLKESFEKKIGMKYAFAEDVL